MSLLLQLNGDLPSHFPDDERRLHIFSCRRKACSRKPGSLRALREVKRYRSTRQAPARPKDEKAGADLVQEQKPAEDLGAALFGTAPAPPFSSHANPFSMPTTANPFNSTPNPFASLPPTSTLAAKPPQAPTDTPEPPSETFASKLKTSSMTPQTSDTALPAAEPWPSASALPPAYPYFYLDADYETLVPEQPTQSSSTASTSKPQYDIDDTPSSSTAAAEKDNFESSLDATFLRFSDRLAQNPSQVLRYEFNGTPVLYSGSDAVAARFGVVPGKTKAQITPSQGMPRCESCGAKRVFELQLVPGLISALEEEIVDLEEGMEWGTIILGVCANNCGEVGKLVFREEWVGVQWEERVVRK
jgi:pre-rRNA-processing protein TSR4